MTKPPKVQNLDITWGKVVQDADPEWARGKHDELEYDFSSPGRWFRGDPYKRGPYKRRPYVLGTLNRTFGRLLASGTIILDGRVGLSTIVFEPVQFTGSGVAPIRGVANVTFAPFSGTATGAAPATGRLNRMLDWMRTNDQFGPMWVSAGLGRVRILGSGSVPVGVVTSAGSGTVAGAQASAGSPMGLLMALTANPPGSNLLSDADNHATGAAWVREGASSWTGSQEDKDLGATAELWTEHTGSGYSYVSQADVGVFPGLVIRKLFFKQKPGSATRYLEIGIQGANPADSVFMFVDASGNVALTGATGAWSVHHAGVIPATNGYYQASIGVVSSGSHVDVFTGYWNSTAGTPFTGDGTSGWFFDDDRVVNQSSARAFRLTAEVGAFTLTGVAAGLRNFKLTADVGAFTLTGVAADLRRFRLEAETGVFALTGNDATLTKAP